MRSPYTRNLKLPFTLLIIVIGVFMGLGISTFLYARGKQPGYRLKPSIICTRANAMFTIKSERYGMAVSCPVLLPSPSKTCIIGVSHLYDDREMIEEKDDNFIAFLYTRPYSEPSSPFEF